MGWDFDFLRRLQHIGIIVINMKHRAPQTRWTNDGLFDALALSYRLTSAVSVSTGRLGWQRRIQTIGRGGLKRTPQLRYGKQQCRSPSLLILISSLLVGASGLPQRIFDGRFNDSSIISPGNRPYRDGPELTDKGCGPAVVPPTVR